MITTATATHPDGDITEVYVLSVRYRDDTEIKGIYTTLELAQAHYGPNSLRPTNPWTPLAIPGQPPIQWHTTFKSGNNGARPIIRRMTLTRTH